MTRLLLVLALGTLVGCTNIYPAGPLAKSGFGPKMGKDKGDKEKEEPPEPVTVPAVKPTPPLNTTGPEDVTPEDPNFAIRKLQQELEADKKTIPTAPKTAEVSRYKNGVKVN
ncbi:MAG: hypothetical protein C0467_22960 [Planctomycetaceae bacterium]|nr:hypothetical protein [Planctomycetaceae bacterium]